MEKVMSVFPQGGVPRPELFLLYINGFPNTIECLTNLFFFANATKIYTDINLQTKKNIIQGDPDKINDWPINCKLKFNTFKCKVMHIGDTNDTCQYCLENQILGECEVEKDLGVYADSKLTFSSHWQGKLLPR